MYNSWKKYLYDVKKKRSIIKKAMTVFWKFHTSSTFKKFKETIRKEKLVKEKNKIDGAYILIEELKRQLKMFDKALERIYKEKAGREDIEMLKKSIDEHRAKSIFNDMKELFDTTIKDM